jgi:hypothetical protein
VKIPPPLAALAFLVSLSCAVISVASAQSPTPTPSPTATPTPPPLLPDGCPTAAITFDDRSLVLVRSGEGHFPRVDARINQAATILLQYPTDLGGQPIIVQSLDGAQVIGDIQNLTLGTDGTVILNVRMGGSEGLYRFALLCGDSHTLLRFYAFTQ